MALLRDGSVVYETNREMICRRIDFSSKAALTEALTEFRPTCVLHCAASGLQFPRPGWFELTRFNVDVSIDLCEAAAAVPGCHFVYISTGLSYRDQSRPLLESDPLDTLHPYGASKAAADMLVRSAAAEFEMPLTVFRPFSFTGVGDPPSRLFSSLLRAAAESTPLNLSPGSQVRDHSATADIAAGIVAAVLAPPPPAGTPCIFNLGSGNRIPLRRLIQSVVEELGLKVEMNFGARDYARHEPMYLVADTTRAQEMLGWRPKLNLAYSVWELAQAIHPSLQLKRPQQFQSTQQPQN